MDVDAAEQVADARVAGREIAEVFVALQHGGGSDSSLDVSTVRARRIAAVLDRWRSERSHRPGVSDRGEPSAGASA